jgi:hypothetical protein
MWGLTLAAAARSAATAPLAAGAPAWCRPLEFLLHLAQPLARAGCRYAFRFRSKRMPSLPSPAPPHAATVEAGTERTEPPDPAGPVEPPAKRVSWRDYDLYWSSGTGRGREHLLDALVARAERAGWKGDFRAEWDAHDLELWPDPWHDVRLQTATEELGGPRRFTRARLRLRATWLTRLLAAVLVLWLVAWVAPANARGRLRAAAPPAALAAVGAVVVARSHWRCRRAVAQLLRSAALAGGLEPAVAAASSDPAAVPAACATAGPARPTAVAPSIPSSQSRSGPAPAIRQDLSPAAAEPVDGAEEAPEALAF